MKITPTSSPRINPDSIKTLWLTVVLIFILGVTSFLVSFNGLLDVAAWVGLPSYLRWTVPAFIDISILAYSMAAVIHKARNERVAATWVSLGVFTLISVVANAVHALSKGEGTTLVQMVIGATIAAAAPIAVFAATEELSRLAFRAPVALTNGPDTSDKGIQILDSVAHQHSKPQEELPATNKGRTGSMHALPTLSGVKEAVSEESASPEQDQKPQTETPDNLAPEPPKAEPAQQNIDDSEKEGADDMELLAAWVKNQLDAGQKVTGASVGRFIGKSPRTGSNRLNELKEARPELFQGEQ
ncbi:DUF2637 domain-containing protein [Rothia sp. P4278]|uniref:DUF2637 domain-containing protein n=1 Tax=Rothia sp. P4278 TaxID=3402658 RepID=UPI003AE0BB3F